MDEAALVAEGAVGADEDVIGYRLPEYLNLKSIYRIRNQKRCAGPGCRLLTTGFIDSFCNRPLILPKFCGLNEMRYLLR